jgi:hypothetical protein
MKWSEASVGHAVMHQIMDRAAIVVPNCGFTGYEADLLVVTRDMRLVDVEIKIDRSDLKADLKKDKWWDRGWDGVTRRWGKTRQEPVQRTHPPKIWKHYYVMPVKVWDEKLLPFIPETSGIITVAGHDKINAKVKMKVIRAAKPDRKAQKITHEEALNLGRLCNLRMWNTVMNISSAKRRLGRFVVSEQFLRSIRDGETPVESARSLFKDVVILDVKRNFIDDTTEYFAWSEKFDEISQGEIVPLYSTIINEDETITWKRED